MPLLWSRGGAAVSATPSTALCNPLTLLQILTHFSARTGLPPPTTVYGSTDQQIVQVRALLEEEGTDLAKRGEWQGMTFEASLTTIANEDQGALTNIAPNCFRHIKNHTIWDRTTKLPICGPMDSQDWQATKAMVNTGPRYRF